MPIRIGANPIAWSNDDMRSLGGSNTLDLCLSQAQKAGFEGMELGHKFPTTTDAMREALEPHQLAFITGWWSSYLLERTVEAEIDAFKERLSLLKGMGCKVCIVCETSNAIHTDFSTPLSKRPILPEADWPGFAAKLTSFADYLQSEGLKLVYHHHMGTIVQSREDIGRLMEQTGPSVKLLLDTGHALYAGASPKELAHAYRSRIAHVHVKDVRPYVRARAEMEEWSFPRGIISGVFTVPGDGCIDFAGVFEELPGYDGWVVIEAEQDPAVANPLVYARMGRNHLLEILQQTGHIVCQQTC